MDIIPFNFNNQVVATYSVLAKFLGTEVKVLSNNFNRNSDRFTEGKHYFKLTHSEAKDSSQRGLVNYQGLKGMTVWTERGCARHSKILQTEKAWDLWEKMEDVYFSGKKLTSLPDFTNPAEAARAWADEVEAKEKLEEQKKLDAPKVKFAEILTESSNTRCIRVWVKGMKSDNGLKVGEREVFDWLREKKYIFKDKSLGNLPCSRYESNGLGYFSLSAFEDKKGVIRQSLQITGKGMVALTEKVMRRFSNAMEIA